MTSTHRMRILEVVHLFLLHHSAGTEVYTEGLADGLRERGHDVHLFFTEKVVSRPNYEVVRRKHHGLECHVLINNLMYESFEETFTNPGASAAFARVLDDVKPDVVHFQHLMLLSLDLPQIAAERGIPTVMTLHDFWLYCARFGQLLEHGESDCRGPEPSKCASCLSDFKFAQSTLQKRVIHAIRWTRQVAGFDLAPVVDAFRKSRILGSLKGGRTAERKSDQPRRVPEAARIQQFIDRERAVAESLKHVNLFLSPSRTVRDRMVSFGLPARRVKVLPLGIRPLVVPERAPLPADGSRAPVFGFIGTLAPHKGAHVAIEAMRLLKGRGELLIYGREDFYPAYAASLREQSQGLAIRFLGVVSRREIGKALAKLDLLIVPSVWLENFPIVIQEARAAGLPVVASDLGGMREAVKDEVDGVLFAPGDAKALARALERFLDHPEDVAKLASRGEAPMTLEEHVKRVEAQLARLVSDRAAPRGRG